MRLTVITSLLAATCLALPTAAQELQVFGSKDGERAATTQILFGANLAGGISIEYGQPMWKAEYANMLDQLKGKLNRLGKDWWTTMTTSFALEIGGTKVPAGAYLLGLHCDKEGKFSLALLEATKGMKAGALPFAMGPEGMNWKPDFTAPLTMKMSADGDIVEKMKMTLDLTKGLDKGSYTLAWGPHQLSAKIAVHTGTAGDAGHEKHGEHGKKAGDEHGKKGQHK